MPALASCVEVPGQKPSETSPGMTHLPTIQRSLHITKMLSHSNKSKMVCLHRPKAPEATPRKQHPHTNSHHQKTLQFFPTVTGVTELTGRDMFLSGKKMT